MRSRVDRTVLRRLPTPDLIGAPIALTGHRLVRARPQTSATTFGTAGGWSIERAGLRRALGAALPTAVLLADAGRLATRPDHGDACATRAYKIQVEAIFADIAHAEGTDKFFAELVAALAESASTYEAFVEERGMDHAMNELPKQEATGWVASCSGGYDFDLGELSNSDASFAIAWWPAANTEHEQWKPEATG